MHYYVNALLSIFCCGKHSIFVLAMPFAETTEHLGLKGCSVGQDVRLQQVYPNIFFTGWIRQSVCIPLESYPDNQHSEITPMHEHYKDYFGTELSVVFFSWAAAASFLVKKVFITVRTYERNQTQELHLDRHNSQQWDCVTGVMRGLSAVLWNTKLVIKIATGIDI